MSGGAASWLPRFGVQRPVTVLVLFVALLVLGAIAWTRIPLTLLPDAFEPRQLWVRVPFPNASPRETDELVVRPIAEQLSTIAGLTQLRSRAMADYAGFTVELSSDVDMDQAYNEVVDRIERAMPDLPEDADQYYVFKYNQSDEPVMWAGATFPDSVDDPYDLMQRVVVPRLERVQGVANVELWGVRSQSIYIDWDRDALLAHGVNLTEVQQQLASDNFQRSSGQVTEGGRIAHVRSLSRLDDLESLRRYPIADGRLVLDDVADVSLRKVADADIDRVDGKRSAAFGVRKESSANTVRVTEQLQAVLDELSTDRRAEGSKFFVFFDQGEQISEASSNLGRSLLQGAALSLLVLFVFLREWRMTLLISAAIPFSMLITLTVLYFRGTSLSLIAMMGLMLAVGMVVDNAIVVVESIYHRRGQGEAPRAAAIAGATEIGLALLASTGTTMIVFLPVILMTGDATAAVFLAELGLPVVFALAASLLVALVFAPLASTFIEAGAVRPSPRWLIGLTERYERVLSAVMRRRTDSMVSVLAMFVLTVAVPLQAVECTGEGEGGLNNIDVSFTVPREADHAEREAIANQFEQLAERHREAWQVRVYRIEIGMHDTKGELSIFLEDQAPKAEIVELVKEALPSEMPGVVAQVGWGGDGGSGRIAIPIYGEEIGVIEQLGEELARRARALPGVLSARLDVEQDGQEELVLRPERMMLQRFGLDARTVAGTVAFALRGNTSMAPLILDDHEVSVVSRLSDEDRASISTLLDFPVFSAVAGAAVPVRAITTPSFERGPGAIRRTDRRTSMDVMIDLGKDVSTEDVTDAIKAEVGRMAMPRGYSVSTDDWRAEQDASDSATYFALGMSVIFVYLLMGMLFESWTLPISILTTIPMAMLGAWWGLYLSGTDMDLMAGIGLVVLVGVVVNNGIVLVDRIVAAREEGLDREAAILDACRTRLRPILMTALTTILGLMPMAFGSSDFIGIPYAPLGRCVMGGMVAATMLTLMFVPFAYAVVDDLEVGTRRLWSAITKGTAW